MPELYRSGTCSAIMQVLVKLAIVGLAAVCAVVVAAMQFPRGPVRQAAERAVQDGDAEFHFLRVEYRDLPTARRYFGGGRGWWMQDWPEADAHFTQGIQRLTRIDIGEGRHAGFASDRIFDYPWIYATQVGFWDLSDHEAARLREYLLRGGFLMVDDFHGPQDWEVFRESMSRVFPNRPILDIENSDAIMRVLYDIKERMPVPGLRHLRRGAHGETTVQMQYSPPQWRAITDDEGRILVAICFNMDVGDAWEHADMPEYPEAMTALV